MRHLARFSLATTLCLCWAVGEIHGQNTISLARPTGQFGMGFDGSWVTTESLSPQSTRLVREWLQVNLGGSVIHPRLFDFALGLQPLWQQTRWTGPPSSESGGLTGLYWNGTARLMAGAPASLSLSTFNNRMDSQDRLGSEYRGDTSGWEGLLNYRNPYLPVTVIYRGRSRNLNWRSGTDRFVHQEDRIRTLRVSARNSKTQVIFERLVFDDRVRPFDYDHYRADAFHRFAWGKDSNLFSAFQYLNRNGAAAYDRLSWFQRARIQHTWTVWSDLFYQLLSEKRPGSYASRRIGELTVNYQPRPGLATSANVRAESRNFNIARQSLYRFRPRVDYAGPLPLDASISLFASMGLEWLSQSPSVDGWVEVADEMHIVGPSSRFLLEEPNAGPASVQVTSIDQVTVYEPDLDYRVLNSDPFTEIFVLPSGRIEAGDTLLVDYRYELGRAGNTTNVIAEFGATVRFGQLTVYHRQALRRSSTGPEHIGLSVLPTGDQITTGLSYMWRPRFGSLLISAEQRRRKSTVIDQTYYTIGGSFGFFVSSDVRGRVGANATLQRSRAFPSLSIYSTDASVDWNPTAYLQFRARLAGWYSLEQFRRKNYLGGGVEGEWRLALLKLRLRFDVFSWNETIQRVENRLVVAVARSF